MNLKIDVLESIGEINRNQWNNIVEHSKGGSIFHSYEWLEAIEGGLDALPRHLVVTKNGSPIATFPNFITKIRGSPITRLYSIDPGYGGPLIMNNEKEVLDAIFEQLPKLCEGKVMSHLIRTYDPYFSRYGCRLTRNSYRPYIECRFYFDLQKGLGAIKSDMSSTARKNVHKATKENFRIADEEIDKAALKTFYGSYSDCMDDIKGVKYPYSFFKALSERMPEQLKMFSIYKDDEYYGADLLLQDGQRSILYAFFNSVKRQYQPALSNYLIDWYSLEYCQQNGIRYYDMGPCTDDFEDGLFVHKSKYGSMMMPIVSWEKVYSSAKWKGFCLANRLFNIWRANNKSHIFSKRC